MNGDEVLGGVRAAKRKGLATAAGREEIGQVVVSAVMMLTLDKRSDGLRDVLVRVEAEGLLLPVTLEALERLADAIVSQMTA